MRSRPSIVALGVLVIACVAACGGPGPVAPNGGTDLRIVQCVPAPTPPQIDDAATSVGVIGGVEGGISEDEALLDAKKTIEARIRDKGRDPGTGRGWAGGGQLSGVRVELPRTGTLAIGEVNTGDRAQNDRVAALVRAKVGELKACYDTDLATDRSITHGVVQWKVTYDFGGRVIEAKDTARAVGANLGSCIARVLKTIVFPASSGAGGVVTVTVPILFDLATPASGGEDATDEPEARAWTPFAEENVLPAPTAVRAGKAAEAAVRTRAGAIAACFDKSASTGSIRAMLRIDPAGELISARVGGLGDKPVEDCIAKALAKLRVVTPTADPVELACDLSRGDARPWRVALGDPYAVIEVGPKQLRHGTETLEANATEPEPINDSRAFVIVAGADVKGAMILLALQWAYGGESALLAYRDGSGPPQFLGMGHTKVADPDAAPVEDSVRPMLRVGAKNLTVCVNRATQQAKLSDAGSVGTLVQRVAGKCKQIGCAPTLLVALDADASAKDLLDVAGAARAAGFDRLLIGGEVGCQPIESPR